MSLPDIDSDATSGQLPSVKLPDTASIRHGDTSTKWYKNSTPESPKSPEYETWVSMEPEGEVVERRRLKPLPKSNSDSALNRNCQDSERLSKIDALVNKTKNIFNTEKLKRPFDLFTSESSPPNEQSRPSWGPDSEGDNSTARQPRFRGFTTSTFKSPLKGLQEKIKDKINERSSSCDGERVQNAENGRTSSLSTRLRIFNEIRNRFSVSPKPSRRISVPLTEAEIERRKGCKTEIIDV